MRNITSSAFRYLPALMLGLIFLLNGCKKDVSPQEPNETDITALAKLFSERGYQSTLIQPFGDTLVITWTPEWDKSKQQVKNDSMETLLIPLIPQLKNIKTGIVITDAHFLGFAKYINIKIAKTTTFYLAEYTTNSEVTVVNPDTFSGIMLLRNLETNKTFVYKYLNGTQI
ncbi:hypothetical protein [Dyadobacter frigoris]|uniref:Uncharacterized protein n=1 Tax=Dyadobacter frigoris TaxID=2576211 RepID=A0A4U6D283_9BACT|nr:hypothetical protein [Dyadobacter frigoris]TKT90746.1 hypothetical protein FDK13_17410 [Dyadobacter frigoris]GLU52080.1 hypothetical protein Dfri01_15410 [Dyadobacter frigoris]